MIQDLLKKLKFSDKEITIYLAILKNNKITPSDLAKYTGIKRTTVYSVVDELSKKGIITQDISSPIKYIMAQPPEDLENIVKKEQIEINKKKQTISSVIKELKNFTSDTRYTVPKIRFISEDELESFLHKQSPVWNDSIHKTNSKWIGFQDHTFVEHYEKWIDWFWEGHSQNVKLELLSNQSPIEVKMEKKEYDNRKIKYFKKDIPFTATTWICGDYVIMVVTNQHPHYAIEIHNATLAKNQREVFNALWNKI